MGLESQYRTEINQRVIRYSGWISQFGFAQSTTEQAQDWKELRWTWNRGIQNRKSARQATCHIKAPIDYIKGLNSPQSPIHLLSDRRKGVCMLTGAFETKPCLKSRAFWRLENWQLNSVGLGLSPDLRDLQLLALVSCDLFRWLSKTSVISDKRMGPATGHQGRNDRR